MNSVAMVTVYRRVARGESWEEAVRPAWQPLWMYRIEQEEGRPLRDILEEAAAAAPKTRYGLADLARKWGVPRKRIGHWCLKWDIRFPRHGMARQIEHATAMAHRIRRVVPQEVREERQAVTLELVARCGSSRRLGKLIGVGANRISEWRRGLSPVPDRWWAKMQPLRDMPGSELVTPARRPHGVSDEHPWMTRSKR